MNKRLAILGHNTRGNEVIELLEMMGGVNGKIDKKTGEPYNVYNGRYFVSEICNVREVAYYIDFESQIRCIDIKDITTDFICYSFEMFLEKFPFKVHDLVNIPEYESTVGICGMRWDKTCLDVEYLVYRCDDEEWYTTKELLEYNDNPNEITKDMEQKDKAKAPNLKGEDYSGKRFGYKIPDGYEFDTISNGKIILKPIKPKYPTTYDDCCDMLNANEFVGYELMTNFPKLINARNAYWKIAGEELGLDVHWEPDWTDGKIKYGITYYRNFLIHNNCIHSNNILVFPTEEMRDAFYENFKDLIEQCKELL